MLLLLRAFGWELQVALEREATDDHDPEPEVVDVPEPLVVDDYPDGFVGFVPDSMRAEVRHE